MGGIVERSCLKRNGEDVASRMHIGRNRTLEKLEVLKRWTEREMCVCRRHSIQAQRALVAARRRLRASYRKRIGARIDFPYRVALQRPSGIAKFAGYSDPWHIQRTGGARRRNIAARKPFHGETSATSGKLCSRSHTRPLGTVLAQHRRRGKRAPDSTILSPDSSHGQEMFSGYRRLIPKFLYAMETTASRPRQFHLERSL